MLSIALLIAPGAIAILLMRSFSLVMFCALLLSLTLCFGGTYLSFFLDSAPGLTIVVLFSLLFILAFINTLRRERRVLMS